MSKNLDEMRNSFKVAPGFGVLPVSICNRIFGTLPIYTWSKRHGSGDGSELQAMSRSLQFLLDKDKAEGT